MLVARADFLAGSTLARERPGDKRPLGTVPNPPAGVAWRLSRTAAELKPRTMAPRSFCLVPFTPRRDASISESAWVMAALPAIYSADDVELLVIDGAESMRFA